MSTNSWIASPDVTKLLDALYADAEENDPRVREEAAKAGPRPDNELDYYRTMDRAYMPVHREFGKLLYALAVGARARTIVEFGTSFGISTIFLASAVRDLGEGKVITTEFEPGKAERARNYLRAAGLEEWVDIRVGDARETLRQPLPGVVDMVLLDGAKGLYLPVLEILEPSLRKGAIIASDNTDHDGLDGFLAHLRDPAKGYVSSAIMTGDPTDGRGHEISVRVW